MESNNKNKFIRVSYALYDVTKGNNGEEMLIERTTDERPFFFISGMGVTLPAFEEKVVDLAEGYLRPQPPIGWLEAQLLRSDFGEP